MSRGGRCPGKPALPMSGPAAGPDVGKRGKPSAISLTSPRFALIATRTRSGCARSLPALPAIRERQAASIGGSLRRDWSGLWMMRASAALLLLLAACSDGQSRSPPSAGYLPDLGQAAIDSGFLPADSPFDPPVLFQRRPTGGPHAICRVPA